MEWLMIGDCWRSVRNREKSWSGGCSRERCLPGDVFRARLIVSLAHAECIDRWSTPANLQHQPTLQLRQSECGPFLGVVRPPALWIGLDGARKQMHRAHHRSTQAFDVPCGSPIFDPDIKCYAAIRS